MTVEIIVITLDGERVDCKVRGSTLSVAGYAQAISLAVRAVAGLFAQGSAVSEISIVQEINKVIDESLEIVTPIVEKIH